MKRYEEFINENYNSKLSDKISEVTWPYYASLNLFDIYLREELYAQGFGRPNIRYDAMEFKSKMIDDKIQIAYEIEIGTQTLQDYKKDIPDYFVGIREFFKPFGYVNMEKGDSTSYYTIFVDFNTLIGNEAFWKAVVDKHKWKLSKGAKLKKETEIPKYPDWIKEKPYFKSSLSIMKFNL
jgi:hypothetical protein